MIFRTRAAKAVCLVLSSLAVQAALAEGPGDANGKPQHLRGLQQLNGTVEAYRVPTKGRGGCGHIELQYDVTPPLELQPKTRKSKPLTAGQMEGGRLDMWFLLSQKGDRLTSVAHVPDPQLLHPNCTHIANTSSTPGGRANGSTAGLHGWRGSNSSSTATMPLRAANSNVTMRRRQDDDCNDEDEDYPFWTRGKHSLTVSNCSGKAMYGIKILYVPDPRQVAHGNVSHITFNSLTLHVSGHDFYLKGADARHTRPVFASDRNTTCRPKDPMLFTEDRAFQMLGWPMICTLDG